MSAINNTNPLKQCQRYMDISDEPLTMLTPIKGYEKMPLVSLEEAVKPLILYIPEIEQMAYVAKQRCSKPPPDNLTEDQSAAILLYTLEWEPKEQSVYYLLNKTLRTEDRQALTPWLLYLKLLFSALALIPNSTRTVYRGVKDDLRKGYKKGEKVVWWGFSSCTSTMDVLHNDAFMGPSGKRTLFAIECESGKDIKQHSYFKKENEILLPAAREFEIKSILPQDGGLTIVQLKETQPKYPLLESSSTISKIVQKFPSAQQTAPIHVQPSQIINQQFYQTSQSQQYYIQTQPMPVQTVPIIYPQPKKRRSCGDYFCIGCGLIFCCPCTVIYLSCKS